MWKRIILPIVVNVIVLLLFALELTKHTPSRLAVTLLFTYACMLLSVWAWSMVDRELVRKAMENARER